MPSAPIPCRSWLASEEAIKFNIYVDCYAAFAGKPAPTGGGGGEAADVCKREALSRLAIAYRANRDRVVVLVVSK